jgi:hypothetical protein
MDTSPQNQHLKQIEDSTELTASIDSILAVFKGFPPAENLEICPDALGCIGSLPETHACRINEAINELISERKMSE